MPKAFDTVGLKSEQFYRFITTKNELSGFLIDSGEQNEQSEQFYRFITTKNELSGFLIDSAFLQGGKWNI